MDSVGVHRAHTLSARLPRRAGRLLWSQDNGVSSEADDHATRTRREICGHKRSPDGTRASRHRRTCPVTTRGSRAHWNNQARSGDEKCKNLRGCTLHRRCSLHTTPRMCTPAIVQTAIWRGALSRHIKSRAQPYVAPLASSDCVSQSACAGG